MSARASVWVPRLAILALSLATVSRLLEAHLGLPRAVNWLHFPIVGLAFALALRALYDSTPSLLAANLALLGAFIASAWINHTGAINAALGFALLAEPFLLYAALIGVSPSRASIRALRGWLLALAIVQIPASFAVLPARRPDRVQGTFTGMGTGHHVMGAVALTGAFYLNCGSAMRPGRTGKLVAWLVTGLLLVLPVLSDAKQVMLAFLVAFVALRAARVRSVPAVLGVAASGILLFGAIYAALWSHGLGQVLRDPRIAGAFAHKFRIFPILAAHFDAPVDWLVGVGPGHGVSRLGGWLLPTYWSALEPLGATRTAIAAEAWRATADAPASSVFAPLFSWAGIFGDIGVAGLAAYGWLLWLVYRRAADDFSRFLLIAIAALGFCFDWLEQYNFMLYALAILAERSLHWRAAGHTEPPAAKRVES